MSESQKRMGRPPGTGAPPEDQRKPRSVRLNDERWEKLKELGSYWLERAIDAAPDDTLIEHLELFLDRTVDQGFVSWPYDEKFRAEMREWAEARTNASEDGDE